MAVVVRREPASSAQVGNTALITEAGDYHGWLGGSCIQPTVVREAMAALAEFVATADLAVARSRGAIVAPGVTAFPMTCHSGGSVDIYLEPVLPAPTLLLFGVSPAAQALARLGKVMGYSVDVVDPTPIASASRTPIDRGGDSAAGRLRRLAGVAERHGCSRSWRRSASTTKRRRWRRSASSPRIWASWPAASALPRFERRSWRAAPRRRRSTRSRTRRASTSAPARRRKWRSASWRRSSSVRRASRSEPGRRPSHRRQRPCSEERDPVCGMTVAVATARVIAPSTPGRTYYFCCGGCRERFLAAPDRYAAAVVSVRPP